MDEIVEMGSDATQDLYDGIPEIGEQKPCVFGKRKTTPNPFYHAQKRRLIDIYKKEMLIEHFKKDYNERRKKNKREVTK